MVVVVVVVVMLGYQESIADSGAFGEGELGSRPRRLHLLLEYSMFCRVALEEVLNASF